MVHRPLILASSSPRRRELLASLGLPFQIVVSNVPETASEQETPAELVARLAVQKASAVAQTQRNSLVIGADTVVVLDGQIFGKPKNVEEAVSYLRRLQGRGHTVYTGVALASYNQEPEVRVSSTDVFFRAMTDREIAAYVATGEPLDKAGGYAIQGIGATLVERISGDYFTVVGLPLCILADLLSKTGWPILEVKGDVK